MNIFDDNFVSQCWNENSEVWTKLSEAGCDICRDLFNSPAFFEMLPDVAGKTGIDVGCGNGHHTRKLADLGAKMTGIDICDNFLQMAQKKEEQRPKGITYLNCNAVKTPFHDNTFDFASSFMVLMDMTDPVAAMREIFRILKPGGFFQFNICHPCTDMPLRKVAFDEAGNAVGLIVGDYYKGTLAVDQWMFGTASEESRQELPLFKIPCIRLMLTQWVNSLIETGFVIERMAEPYPSAEVVKRYPQLKTTVEVPFFLHVRVRKPTS